jgi:hypothetical protein
MLSRAQDRAQGSGGSGGEHLCAPLPLMTGAHSRPSAHWALDVHVTPEPSPVHRPPVSQVPEQQQSQVPPVQEEPLGVQQSQNPGLTIWPDSHTSVQPNPLGQTSLPAGQPHLPLMQKPV